MVLLGLGVLIASFSFLVFWHPPRKWSHLLSFKPSDRKGPVPPAPPAKQKGDDIGGKRYKTRSEGDEQSHGGKGLRRELERRDERGVEGEDENSTRKTKAAAPTRDAAIPTFTLSNTHHDAAEDRNATTPGSQRISASEKPTTQVSPSKSTMPPPPLPTSRMMSSSTLSSPSGLQPHTLPSKSQSKPTASPIPSPRTTSSALRPPPSTASTLRAPPSSSLAPPKSSPFCSSLSPGSTAISSTPSRKVLLSPGHSPLDWAHLTAHPPNETFLRGANVPPRLIRVPPSLLKQFTGRRKKIKTPSGNTQVVRTEAWSTYQGKVYNLTPYLDFHPGGLDQLIRGAGKIGEGEKLFVETHPWVSWEGILGECLVGILVGEGEGEGQSINSESGDAGMNRGGGLEEMD